LLDDGKDRFWREIGKDKMPFRETTGARAFYSAVGRTVCFDLPQGLHPNNRSVFTDRRVLSAAR